MRFLADMGIAIHTVHLLRQRGHEAVHLREENLQRLEDSQIVEKAVLEDRVILTHDLDFARLVALAGSRLPSVITFRLRDMRPPSVERLLLDVIERFETPLRTGCLISVTDEFTRVRPLPVDQR